MSISSIFIIILLLVTIVLLAYLIFMVRRLQQPIIKIDEKSAKLVAQKLGELKIPETNEFDAVIAAVNNECIADDKLPEIIDAIKK